MNKILNSHRKDKNGMISIEYIIILSIVVIFAITLYFYNYHDNVVKVFGVSENQMNHVLAANEDNGIAASNPNVDYSDNTTLYPEEEKWDNKDNFSFTGDASGITITGYKATATDVIIPATINGMNVIKIGNGAFADKNLKSVKIPSNVTEIKDNAFKNNKLSVFVAPASLTSIGNEVFMNNKLNAVSFNASLKKIGNGAFKNNVISTLETKQIVTLGENCFTTNDLTSIKIGQSLVTIGDGTFLNQGGLNGKAGYVSIEGDEKRFNANWQLLFDGKFYSSIPK